MTLFSSRGPTRGSYVDAAGVRRIDNLIKPDLVAPGNPRHRRSLDHGGGRLELPGQPNYYNDLVVPSNSAQYYTETGDGDERHLDRRACGRRRRRAAAAGQPGLTPPLVKAILQYTAQPLPARASPTRARASSTSTARWRWRA